MECLIDMGDGIGMRPRGLEEIQNAHFSKLCVNEVLEKPLQNQPSPVRHVLGSTLLRCVLDSTHRAFKSSGKCAGNVLCSPTQSFLLFGVDWVYRVRFSLVFLFRSATVGFVIRTKGTIIPTPKCITNILCTIATGRKHGQHPPPFPECSTSSLFTLQCFK